MPPPASPVVPAAGFTSDPPPLTFSVWVAGILRRRRLLYKMVGAVIGLAVLAGLLLPSVYRASSSFVPNAGASRLTPGLSSSPALQGITAQLGLGPLNDPSESPNFYAKLVQSQELRRRLVNSRFANPRTPAPSDSATLIQILRIGHRDPLRRVEIAIKRLAQMVRVEFDTKTSLVTVTADARWPDLSMALANRTIEFVSDFNREQRVSRAQSKRLFLENRLATAYDELRAAEERQRTFYEQNRQWRNAPSLTFEESRHRRNVELAGDLYLALRQQFEMARLEEFNDAALITVVDRAVLPRKPQWPRWGILLTSATILGMVLGIVIAGSIVVLEDWRARNPTKAGFLRDSLPANRFRRWRKTRIARAAAAAS